MSARVWNMNMDPSSRGDRGRGTLELEVTSPLCTDNDQTKGPLSHVPMEACLSDYLLSPDSHL